MLITLRGERNKENGLNLPFIGRRPPGTGLERDSCRIP